MLQPKSVQNRVENKEEKKRKKKKEEEEEEKKKKHKWFVVGDTTFIIWKRLTSVSLAVPRQYPVSLLWTEIRKRRMKSDWKLIFSRTCVMTLFLLMIRGT
jgi:hypothetical protein